MAPIVPELRTKQSEGQQVRHRVTIAMMAPALTVVVGQRDATRRVDALST